MGQVVVFCLCIADIPLVLSAYIYNCSKGLNVDLYVANSKLQALLLDSAARTSPEPTCLTFINILDRPSIFRAKFAFYDSMYIFTLGTYESCQLVVYALSNRITVFYQDVYMTTAEYPLRLESVIYALFFGPRFAQVTFRNLIGQLVRQFTRDPLFRHFYFSADYHCWLTTRTLRNTCEPTLFPATISPKIILPDFTLVFAFSSHDCPWEPDWAFFYSLPFQLVIKPHPFSASDYNLYPSGLAKLDIDQSIRDIFFGQTSFLISCSSTALAETKSSISLELLRSSTIYNPVTMTYAKRARFLPHSYNALYDILSSSASLPRKS
jgi:hypothetical protein